MIQEIFPFATYKWLSTENSFYVTARLKVKNPHISRVCFLCVLFFKITFRMQSWGLMRDHQQQYSLNLDSLVFKSMQAHGETKYHTNKSHQKECLLIRGLQSLNNIYIRFFKWGKKKESLPFSFYFFCTEPKCQISTRLVKISTRTKNSIYWWKQVQFFAPSLSTHAWLRMTNEQYKRLFNYT